jgi:hypothetical protein
MVYSYVLTICLMDTWIKISLIPIPAEAGAGVLITAKLRNLFDKWVNSGKKININ